MDTITFLEKDETIGTIGFIAGMTYVIFCEKSQNNIITNPLATLCGIGVFGSIYSCMAIFVGGLFPGKIKLIVPICLMLSILYYIMLYYV